jgi:hypothetical protein
VARIAEYMKLTEEGYREALERTRALVREYDFQRLVWLIRRALELADELDTEDLRRLIPDRLLAKYGIEERTLAHAA